MNEEALQNLAGRFDKLEMKNSNISHPHEFIVGNFPTFNDFYEYFADCCATYKGEKPFAEMLFVIYHDLRDLPVLVNNMNRGIKPRHMEKVFNSMRTLNELTKKKFAQANVWLAQNYATKH